MQRGENRLWPRCDQTLDEESRVLLSSELDGLKAKYYERICIQSVEDDLRLYASETWLSLGNFLCNSENIPLWRFGATRAGHQSGLNIREQTNQLWEEKLVCCGGR